MKELAKRLEVALYAKPIPPGNATDVFVRVICAIGPELVSTLGLRLNGEPLVSPDKPHHPHKQCGRWYIQTHCSTDVKHSLLVKIRDKLNLNMAVQLVDPPTREQRLHEIEKELLR